MPTVVQQRAFSVHFPWVYRAVLGAQAARQGTHGLVHFVFRVLLLQVQRHVFSAVACQRRHRFFFSPLD
jgi:hypothetical protein